MAHWRDGGIGNMAGSDDRPIEEFTLLEKLAVLADMRSGMTMPAFLAGPNGWGEPLAALMQEAFDEIVRLREAVEAGRAS